MNEIREIIVAYRNKNIYHREFLIYQPGLNMVTQQREAL